MPGTPGGQQQQQPQQRDKPKPRADERGAIPRLAERKIIAGMWREIASAVRPFIGPDSEQWRIFREVWFRHLNDERTSAHVLAHVLELPRTTVRQKLTELVQARKLERVGSGTDTTYRIPDKLLRSTAEPGGILDRLVMTVHLASAQLREIERESETQRDTAKHSASR